MKLSFTSAFLCTLATSFQKKALAQDPQFGDLPPTIGQHGNTEAGRQLAWEEFVKEIFPTWCVDANGERIDEGSTLCADGSPNGRWTPFYLTKWHGGEDPALGGYPTDIDTGYPFYYGSGFFGQSGAGGNAHCSFEFDGSKNEPGKCGKIVTEDDSGPNGPGHVPPHIGLAALTRTYYDTKEKVEDWFDYEQNGCRVLPHKLLSMIRKYFPRDEESNQPDYPPPFTNEGGVGGSGGAYPYPLEFVNLVGQTCEDEQDKFPSAVCSTGTATENGYPEYLKAGHGSPHYCSESAKTADVYNDWCPYIFFGPNRGKYRHPHVAFAAVETWLANKAMPNDCGKTWDENDGADYPFTPDNSVAFPEMEFVSGYKTDPKQPRTSGDEQRFFWPGAEGSKRKSVKGVFVIEKYLAPTPARIGKNQDPNPPLPRIASCRYKNYKGVVVKDGGGQKRKCQWIKKRDTLKERRELCNGPSLKKGKGKKIKQVSKVCPQTCGEAAGLGRCRDLWLLAKGGMQFESKRTALL